MGWILRGILACRKELLMTFAELQETYQLIGKIGGGSGGEIYKGIHRRMKKAVVLKRMIQPSADEMINRKEVEILKNLHYPFLPAVIDYLQVDGDVFTVMDFIDGESLDDKAKKQDRFSLGEIRRWGSEIASALAVLHGQNPKILHLDVKPGNIMIRDSGEAVLVDFNISLDGNAVSRIGYSDHFCPPEQKEMITFASKHHLRPDVSKLSEATDLYSLGAVLYYLATGKWYNPSNPQWVIISQTYVPELTEILKKALEEEPSKRYQSAEQMKADLAGMEDASQKMQAWKKKRKLINGICYAGLCICVILFGVSFYLMNAEKQNDYERIVDQMASNRAEGSLENNQNLFDEARKLQPSQLRAFYEQASTLYQKGDYERTANFIRQSILNNPDFKDMNSGMENTYYLLADSLYQQKEYRDAVDVYDQLFEMEKLQPVFYRDYAIALGYNKQFDKASKILEDAAAKGLDNASLTYAKAEIAYAKQEGPQALVLMNQALSELDNDSMRLHAFEKIAEWNIEARNYTTAREILLKAKEDLPVNLQPVILQTLIQTDSKLAEATGDQTYRQEAVNAIQELIDSGQAVYSDYNNLAVFYEKMDQLDQAEQAVAKMTELYGEDYNTFKRQAFLEIDRQALLANNARDYSCFLKLYQKAEDLYNTGEEKNDIEMTALEERYRDLQKGGWL